MAEDTARRIVVGVDGSKPALAALRWAATQARLTGARVDAVIAWDVPVAAAWAPVDDVGDLEGEATERLSEAVHRTGCAADGVEITQLVARGHPAAVLVRAAQDADLLVVGCRGRGGFVGSLLGSVSQYCVTHGPCPVLVIRGAIC